MHTIAYMRLHMEPETYTPNLIMTEVQEPWIGVYLLLSQRARRVPRREATKNIEKIFNGVATNFYLGKKSEKPFKFAKTGL